MVYFQVYDSSFMIFYFLPVQDVQALQALQALQDLALQDLQALQDLVDIQASLVTRLRMENLLQQVSP